MEYDFKCMACGGVATEHEWNQYTYEKCGGYSAGASYKHDDGFFTISQEYEYGEGAWFYCPNCEEYHDGAGDLERVTRQYHSNKEAKRLLERSW
jgi:hypothetical protein